MTSAGVAPGLVDASPHVLRVLCTRPLHPAAAESLRRFCDVVVAPDARPDTIRDLAADVDAIIARDPIPTEVFDATPSLLAIVRHGVGTDGIDLAAASASGVLVVTTPGANAVSVAEHAVLLMLMLARRLRTVDHLLRTEGWEPARDAAQTSLQVSGKTVGIIGTGSVGRAIAHIVGPGFGMRVLGHEPDPTRVPAGILFRPLDDLLRESDVVVLACPLTDETRRLIDSRRLRLMRPTAVLVNIARGPLVDEPALIDALRQGRLAGAALDVFNQQPLRSEDPLLSLDNVVLTPHAASLTVDSMATVGLAAVDALREIAAGRIPQGAVNAESSRALGAPADS